ncbi:MAG: DUF3179 domain-containing (seleno)protein [Bacteroidota bacterium]
MNFKALFYVGIIGLILFEIANVYFIMPMPGSQRMDSLDFAYNLYQYRWVFRTIFGVFAVAGLIPAYNASVWKTLTLVVLAGILAFMFNFYMSADHMFYKPDSVKMVDAANNKVKPEKLVLGVEHNGEARAYPIQFLGYHHQVQDTVGGLPVLVTYCTVCRTGRVYQPVVSGQPETFRLVGMDHFNAMFEDNRSGSWWQQATGTAVAGPLKGTQLPELPATQGSLAEWLKLYPQSKIMQADSTFSDEYADMDTYDVGIGRGKLTYTDTLSWKEKSWVIGIQTDRAAKAFDWNRLKQERIINDRVGNQHVVLALASDNKSFFAYARPDSGMRFSIRNDTLCCGNQSWTLLGRPVSPETQELKKVQAYQEFWHSWDTFHPRSAQY